MAAKPLRIALGADHAGYWVKSEIVRHLSEEGYPVIDYGAHTEEPSDYPDFASRVARAVASGRCDRGILACGSGIGMAIAANKVSGIRAAAVWSPRVARLASQHNWANVLCLPSRFVKISTIKNIVKNWLDTPYDKGGRHDRRVKKIIKLESK